MRKNKKINLLLDLKSETDNTVMMELCRMYLHTGLKFDFWRGLLPPNTWKIDLMADEKDLEAIKALLSLYNCRFTMYIDGEKFKEPEDPKDLFDLA